MADDLRSAFGFYPVPDIEDLAPGTKAFAVWEWAVPLRAILKFGGWTIDDVINDRRTAAAVRQLWSVWNLVRHDSAERKARKRAAMRVHTVLGPGLLESNPQLQHGTPEGRDHQAGE